MADVNYKTILEKIPFYLVSINRGITGNIKMHAHSFSSYEIHYIESGEGILRIPGKEFCLKRGSFFLTGPGIHHEQITTSKEPMIELAMYYTIPIVFIEKQEKEHGRQTEPWLWKLLHQRFWMGEASLEICEGLSKLIHEIHKKESGYQTMIPFLFGSLLVSLGRLYLSEVQTAKEKYVFLSDEGKYLKIERIFLEDPVGITIKNLAEQLGFSVRQLQRLMKSHYGITFQQMQMNYKLDYACGLLTNTELSVGKIAEQAGFSSGDYFGYCFRKHFGISPAAYRKKRND